MERTKRYTWKQKHPSEQNPEFISLKPQQNQEWTLSNWEALEINRILKMETTYSTEGMWTNCTAQIREGRGRNSNPIERSVEAETARSGAWREESAPSCFTWTNHESMSHETFIQAIFKPHCTRHKQNLFVNKKLEMGQDDQRQHNRHTILFLFPVVVASNRLLYYKSHNILCRLHCIYPTVWDFFWGTPLQKTLQVYRLR